MKEQETIRTSPFTLSGCTKCTMSTKYKERRRMKNIPFVSNCSIRWRKNEIHKSTVSREEKVIGIGV
jgi:hypothetical protein